MEDIADPVDSDKLESQNVVQEQLDKPEVEEQIEKREGEEKAKESDGNANDGKAAPVEEDPTERPHRGKTLEQMMSLKEGDDERTQISKKVSWILRHGARKVSIEIDVDGWVNISEILALPTMTGVTEEKLMDIIDESNQQKVRYELKDAEDDKGRAIRAVSKHTISGMTSTVAREQRRIEREQRREQRQDFKEAVARGEIPTAIEEDDSCPDPRIGIDDGPTYEQQLEAGYRPVYQGNRVVAMVKEGPEGTPLTEKPGRQTRPEYKGEFKGNFKGDYRGKGDLKGYGDSKGYGKDFRRDTDNYDSTFHRSGYGGYNSSTRGEDDHDYRGSKGSKDGGKGYRDEKGYRGYDRRDYGKYGGKGYGADDVSYDRVRWRVCLGQEAVVRARIEMESEAITKLVAGTLVYQTGDCIANEHGIIRMPMEMEDGVRGWVTRTAEAANGPAFFRREGHEKGGRGYGSEKGSGKTYDRDFGYGSEKGSGKNYNRDFGYGSEKGSGKNYSRDFGYGSEKGSGKNYDRDFGYGSEKGSGKNYDRDFGYGKGKSKGGKAGSKGGQWDEVSKGSNKGTFEHGYFSMGS